MKALVQDIKYALRMLGKSPAFTAVAMLTLALGIGANAAIFSFTDQVLLRSLPVPNASELAVLHSPGPNPGRTWADGDSSASFSYPMYKELRDRNTVFSGLLACFPVALNVSGHGGTESAHGELVSGNFFQTLEVPPAMGRVFSASDETAPGANPVAVLSYGYWMRQFGGDSSILNQPLSVNGAVLTVVGVARKGFEGVQVGTMPDVYIPLTMKAQMSPDDRLTLDDRGAHWLGILGRVKAGMSREKAQASLQPIYSPLLEEDAKIEKMNPSRPRTKEFLSRKLLLEDGSGGRQILQQSAKQPLLVLMGMVGVVLLIACANLAGLLVARGEARQREIAVRLALGAGRGRLIRQLLTESLVIAIGGGAAGIAAASWGLNAMVGAIPQGVMTGFHSGLDMRVLWFAIALTAATSVLVGLAPALRATRINLQSTLKDQGSSVSEGRSNIRLRKILIIGQVTLTAVLLAGAGLFGRTLMNLEHADLGLRIDHILQFSVVPELNRYTPEQTVAFGDSARQMIASTSGVRSVSASWLPIFSGSDSSSNITPEGYVMHPDEDTNVMTNWIGPNYFSTMGIALVSGREFTEADTAKSQKVVIINEKMAQRFFAGKNPLGMHVAFGSGNGVRPDMEIVGVAKNSKWDDARTAVTPFMYLPYSQFPQLGQFTFYVRTERDPSQMAVTLHELMRRLDPNLPLTAMMTLNEQLSEQMFSDGLVAVLSVSLALLAALLAALGLYGVLAYVVARRTREIGIRMALGGQRSDILRIVLAQGAWLTLIGGVMGIAAGFGVARLTTSLLYGVTPSDPLTFAGVAVLLVIVAGAACYIPARRAMRVDPMVALRYE